MSPRKCHHPGGNGKCMNRHGKCINTRVLTYAQDLCKCQWDKIPGNRQGNEQKIPPLTKFFLFLLELIPDGNKKFCF